MGDTIGRLVVDIGARMGALDKAFATMERKLGRLQGRFQAIGNQLSTGISLPLALAGGAAVKFAATFDEAMARSLAIMGQSGQQMRGELEATARAVARTSTFSAREAAEAYYFLASAGLDAAQSIEALPAVVDFATAGAFDLATATDLLTDAQSALGLTTQDATQNLRNMVDVSDTLVAANTLANASVEQFSQALTNRAGAALRLVGKDIEEGVAVLAAWADQGTKGAEAGTRLDIVLRDLQKAAVAAKNSNREFYDAVFDIRGEMRNLGDVVSWLESLLDGMSDAQKRTTISTLGLQEKSITATLSLIGLSEKIRGYEASLRAAAGTTQSVADRQLDNFADKMRLVWARVEDLLISLGKSMIPTLEKLAGIFESIIGWIEGGVKWFSDLDETVKDLVLTITILVAGVGPLLVILGKMIGVVWSLTAAFRAFFVTLYKNPIGLIIGLLGSAVAIMTSYREETDATARQTDRLGRSAEEATKQQRMLSLEHNSAKQNLFDLTQRVQELTAAQEKVPAGSSEWFKYQLAIQDARKEIQGITQDVYLLQNTINQLHGGEAVSAGIERLTSRFQTLTDMAEGAMLRVGESIAGVGKRIAEMALEFDTAQKVWQEYALQVRVTAANLAKSAVQLVDQTVGGIANALGQSVGRALVYQEELAEIGKQLLQNFLAQTISTISSLIIQWAIYFALGVAGFETLAQKAIWASAKRAGAGAAASVAETVPFPLSLFAAAAAAKSMQALVIGLQAFAKGGIVTGPTLGLIGEAGTEAVLPLDRLEGMLGSRRQTIVLELDGQVIGQAAVENMPGFVKTRLGNLI